MPSAIDATVGGSGANSYLTLAAFAARAADSPSATAVAAASDDAKTRALLQATQRLDLEQWSGARATNAQRLAWPRIGVLDPDRRVTSYGSTLGRAYDVITELSSTTIPERVQAACATLAAAIIGGVDFTAADETRGITRERIGPIETEYAPSATRWAPDSLRRYSLVWRAIEPLLSTAATSGSVVRG